MPSMQKCGVIGVGFVGATCAYTLAVSGLFSEVVLVDMNRKKRKARLRISTTAFPSPSPVLSVQVIMLTSPAAA